jgi:hypothetical protein
MKAVRIFISLCALASAVCPPCLGADPYPDDYPDAIGDGPAPLPFGTPGVSGRIERDIDRDVFSFAVTAGKEYAITVTPSREANGLWDADVEFGALAGGGVPMSESDSVGAANAEVVYSQPGGTFSVYVSIGGFAQFTTGRYDVVVHEQTITDSDGDELPDAWERYYFPTLDSLSATNNFDGDAFTDLEEYYLGTNPTDLASGLAITQAGAGSPIQSVTWNSNPLREYEIWANPSLLDPEGWRYLDTVPGDVDVTTFVITDHNGSFPQRFYQIRVPFPVP